MNFQENTSVIENNIYKLNLQSIFNIHTVIIYLVIINIIAFLSMYIDKKKAKWGRWRIPENTLFLYAILGGTAGSIVGMYTFRHKTKKPKFYVGMPALLVLQILAVVAFMI